jgi:steroid delta-isomerase-like uncharacterized protein
MVLALVVLLPAAALAAPDDPKVLLRAFVDATNSRDWNRLGELVSADFTRHCQATPDLRITSREEFLAFQREDVKSFPDAQVDLHHVVAEDDLVAIWATYSGTQDGPMGPFAATGKRMELDFGAIFRVENGVFVELWVTWDNLAAMSQLGLFPPPAPEAPEAPRAPEAPVPPVPGDS